MLRNQTMRVVVAAAVTGLLAGCSTGTGVSTAATQAAVTAAVSGRVHGGQQPVTGASIGMWAVTTSGTAASSILTGVVTTDANGNFSLVNKFTCPSGTAQVYLTANGGNPGLPGSVNNGSLALMAAVGPCNSITSSTFLTIDEVTTVAAVWALQQFLGVVNGTPFAETVGVTGTASSVTGMVNAFATAQNLATLSTGVAGGPNANATAEVAKINTIADILATCVNSDGTGGTTGACGSLFAMVSPTGQATAADTIQAALDMAQNPTINLAGLFGLQPAMPVFQPALSAAPFDWTLGILYTNSGLNLPTHLAVDAGGNIWIANAGSAPSGLVELAPNGQPASGSPFQVNQLFVPGNVSIDTIGNVWTPAMTADALLEYTPSSNTSRSLPAPGPCGATVMAIDGADDLFGACIGVSGSNQEYQNFEYVNQGTTSVPVYGNAQLNSAAEQAPYGMAVDTLGNTWVTDSSASQLDMFNAAGVHPIQPGTYSLPYGVAIDHSNNVWVANSGNNNVVQLLLSGSTYTPTSFPGAGQVGPIAVAVDGAGYVWTANDGATTLNGTRYVSVSKLSNTGAPISPDASASQPGGYAKATTAVVPQLRDLAIDPSGNVWVAGCNTAASCQNGTSFLMELVGAAAPVVTPLSVAQGANQLGCCGNSPPVPGSVVTNPAGLIALGSSIDTPTQNAGSFSFAVYRQSGSTGAVTVQYATTNGTASAGTDYTAQSGTLSWAAGDSSVKTITVPWLDTTNYSGTKTFSVTLSNPTGGAALGTIGTTLVSVTDSLKPPYPTFNFANWKLQTPVDIYGGTGGVNGSQFADSEIASSVLDAGFSAPYFYLNSSGYAVFTAFANGATTSPGSGSNHTRSELRELYTGSGADQYSNWNSATGGTLNATVNVASVAPASDEATIGQIHGESATFVVLQYRASGSLAVQLYATPTATSSTLTTLLNGVSLNDTLSYTLQYSGNTLNVTVNDLTKSTTATQAFSLPAWAGQSVYFKLGAYHAASNTGNGSSDQTQVVVRSFAVSHP